MALGMPPSLASTSGMPNKDRSFHDAPEKAGGEGWLYSEQQQKLCHFKPDTATVHSQWVAIRTYSYVPPRPPEPMTRRRMLRHNAIEAWETMQNTGESQAVATANVLAAFERLKGNETATSRRVITGSPLEALSRGIFFSLQGSQVPVRPC